MTEWETALSVAHNWSRSIRVEGIKCKISRGLLAMEIQQLNQLWYSYIEILSSVLYYILFIPI